MNNPEFNQDHLTPLTCKDCGKLRGQGQIGTHWICEDCKVDEKNENRKKGS